MTIKLKKTRILIVDDFMLVRDLIKLFYAEYDFELLEAANGLEAIEMALTCLPDLILLDVHMPVMSGWEAAVILKNSDVLKDIPILVITADDCAKTADLMNGTCNGFLHKPFAKDELIRATMQYLPGKTDNHGDTRAEIA